MAIRRIRERKAQAASNLQGISAEQNAAMNGVNAGALDNMFSQIKKFDPKLTREEFDAQAKANPAAVQAIYESVKPRSIIGTSVKLADGSEAKVTGVRPYSNAPGFYLQTDKGELTVYSKDFIESGGAYNGDKSYITAVSPEILSELESGKTSLLSSSIFSDLPSKNNTGLDISGKDFYVFTDPVAAPNLNVWFYDPGSVDDRYEGLYAGGLKLTQGPNGKLYYAGESGGGNQAQVGFLHGDRAGVNRPFTNTPAGSGFSGSGQTVTQKGGLLGKLGASIGKVLDNPLVQLGVSAFGGAPLVGAYNLGKVGGGLATGQLSFGDALKGVATAAAAQGIGSLSGGFSNAVKDAVGGSLGNIAGGAAQGAIQGGAGSLLSGGDVGQGLLGGALFGGGQSTGKELLGQTGSFIDQQKRANQEFFGLKPNTGAPSINFGDPNNFGPQFNLPSTTGFFANAPSIGGLFDDVEFPGMGLNPNATGLLNFGSGVGQGLTIPKSPTLSGQLGQGLTVGVPGGTLGQGGITPTGQITLGNPNSFINGGQGSSSGFDASRLIRGLLGAGTAAAIGNALAGSNNNQQQAPSSLPVDRYSLNEQRFNYGGDINKYGTTDTGDFQFYKSNIGLLG